jgi:ribose 5-phosphate isomerase B
MSASQPAVPVVVIGCDHAAVPMKDELRAFIEAMGAKVIDVGTHGTDRVDYPDVAVELCTHVVNGDAQKGVLLCGSGIGVSITANKVDGIRAALCHDHYTAKMCREHNDANVLCAGARTTGIEVVKDMVEIFLATEFAGGRHAGRVEKIMAVQK